MFKTFSKLLLLCFIVSGCGSSYQPEPSGHTDQKLEQIKRQREESMKKSDRVNCQNNRGSRECLGVY